MYWLRICVVLLPAAVFLAGQSNDGEIRFTLHDETGQALQAAVLLKSASNATQKTITASADGSATFQHLPYGRYQYVVARDKFMPATGLVDLHSPFPVDVALTLKLGSLATTVNVEDSETLLDPHDLSSPGDLGKQQIEERERNGAGRSLPDLVAAQPGWLLEANGVLHPRGSEYQVQYVVNGLPLTENRSPTFAAPLDTDDIQSMRILTGSYPAEFGRKLGGVISLTTSPDMKSGVHGSATIGGGSFDSRYTQLTAQNTAGRNLFSVSGAGERTDRYLDSPVPANYNNTATTSSFAGSYQRDLSDADRINVSYQHNSARFEVPNENVQQAAGQRQDRENSEDEMQARYQHIFSPSLLLSAQGLYHNLSASLNSNPLSTPIEAFQDRGFHQGYTAVSIAGQNGANDWKAGVDFLYTYLRERFSYNITNPDFFDPDTPLNFLFRSHAPDREAAGYVQDVYRWRNLNVSAGLRWDGYHVLVDDNAVSPRLGASFYWPKSKVLFHASYDRAFQTPAIENLLLASSPDVGTLNNSVLRIPVPPSRGNFYEAGMSRVLGSHLRLDVNWFRRNEKNFADDDVLLNTGVSFPIAFARAEIAGTEVRLQVPRWGPVTAYISYSNQTGTGHLPVTGGLFLGDDAAGQLGAQTGFPITQDQRNTASARVRLQVTRRIWASSAAYYGSGLPTELQGADIETLKTQYSPDVLARVNFARNRVRPSFDLSFSAGASLWQRETKAATVQVDVYNVTDRLNVINFAGLFSGTAIAPPRSASARLNFRF